LDPAIGNRQSAIAIGNRQSQSAIAIGNRQSQPAIAIGNRQSQSTLANREIGSLQSAVVNRFRAST
jgi:regulator of protease activity HflC (stomatin/prohibitin superfamily)